MHCIRIYKPKNSNKMPDPIINVIQRWQICSCCNRRIILKENEQPRTNCPTCGARLTDPFNVLLEKGPVVGVCDCGSPIFKGEPACAYCGGSTHPIETNEQ